jgi:type II secretory pathway component PulK
MRRRGFALVAVLWTVTVLGVVAGVGLAGARLGERATDNRLTMTRSRWAAEACLVIAEARAVMGALGDTGAIDLGRALTCTWTVRYPDARLDLNAAPRAALLRLAVACGVAQDAAGSLAAAVIEGRRTDPWTDVRQVPDLPPAIVPYLTVDGSGRVDAATAPSAVLGSLPGMTPEAVSVMLRRRRLGPPITNLDQLAGALSPAARGVLEAGYADLAPLVEFGSGRVVVTAQGRVASYGRYPQVTIEVVAQRLPDRLAILRRRML